jgi:hypothetical protein
MSGNKLKEARAVLEETKDVIDQELEDHGWDVDIEEGFEEANVKIFPKVRLSRKARMADSVLATRVAKAYYGKNLDGYEPSTMETMIAKASVMLTFDGEKWDCTQIEALDESFFQTVWAKLARFLV